MPRPKFQTLTEQMFYILLCLKTECYGIDLFDRIAEMTDKRVTVGSGTLYNLLEEFLDADRGADENRCRKTEQVKHMKNTRPVEWTGCSYGSFAASCTPVRSNAGVKAASMEAAPWV